MTQERYSATISRGKDGTINVRISRGDPASPDGEELIEVLYGDVEDELKERALKFAQEKT